MNSVARSPLLRVALGLAFALLAGAQTARAVDQCADQDTVNCSCRAQACQNNGQCPAYSRCVNNQCEQNMCGCCTKVTDQQCGAIVNGQCNTNGFEPCPEGFQCVKKQNRCRCSNEAWPAGTNGNCVWYAYHSACCEWGEALEWCTNANTWADQAEGQGDKYSVIRNHAEPRARSIFVQDLPGHAWGHVGWVDQVLPNGRIQTIEQSCCCSNGKTLHKVRRTNANSHIIAYILESDPHDNSALASLALSTGQRFTSPEQSVAVVVEPSQSVTATLTVRNTGSSTWDALHYVLSHHRGATLGIAQTDITMTAGTSVGPNDTYAFTLQLQAPSSPGTHRGIWLMNHVDVGKFGAQFPIEFQVKDTSLGDITREEIASRAQAAVGLSYWLGHARWVPGGDNPGWCDGVCSEMPGEDECSHQPHPETTGEEYGADASGFAAKAWGVPQIEPLDQDSHPYSISQFYNSRELWKEIPLEEARQGDAFVCDSDFCKTIVIVDGPGNEEGTYAVWECADCLLGCMHSPSFRHTDEFKVIRRVGIIGDEEEQRPCPCSGHGRVVGAACQCFEGFAGAFCDRCDEARGYSNYPNCANQTTACTSIQGDIAVGDMVVGDTREGSNEMEAYRCSNNANLNEDGPELIYRFQPQRTEKVQIKLSHLETDLELYLMPNDCRGTSCRYYGDNELRFLARRGDTYYVAVDSWEDAQGDFNLWVNSLGEYVPYVGSPCTSDADCNFHDRRRPANQGRCHPDGFCTLPCRKVTSRRNGKSYTNYYCTDKGDVKTFCVDDPSNQGQGTCVAKAKDSNGCCADIPGTTPKKKDRFKTPAVNAWVCVSP